MPSDIRSFFGGTPSSTPTTKADPKESTKKRARARKVIEDEDDEDEKPLKKATPQKKMAAKEEVMEETTADDFFGKGSKPKRSEQVSKPAKSKPVETNGHKTTPKKGSKPGTGSARSSARKKKQTSYAEFDENDFPDDDLDEEGDNFQAEAKRGRRMGDDYKEEPEDEDDIPLVPRNKSGRQKKVKADDEDDFAPDEDVGMNDINDEDDFIVPDDEEEIVKSKPAKKAPATVKGGRKRKSADLDDEDDDLDVEPAKPASKTRTSPAKKSTPAKKAKKEEVQDSAEMKAIMDNIPTIKAPSPPPKDGSAPKWKFGQHANSQVPAGALDPSEIPTGEDNCLAGLSFVFTGQLQRLGRDQGQNLVKQYGGKVMSGPSKKTSYIVLGEDAGPKKLEMIKEHNLAVINEDGLFALIERRPANGGDSKAGAEAEAKKEKENERIRKAAEEIDNQERAAAAAAKSKAQANGQTDSKGSKGKASAQGPDTRLWTVRYAPQQLSQICGNQAAVGKLQRWLSAFPKNQRTKFKLPGADGSGAFRAVMIHGPPGIGKTTAAHLVAKLEGYDTVEFNASDTRSKKLVETGLKGVLSTTSLMGYFGGPGTTEVDASKKKLVLIMDEVDGMSGSDRGGVGALAAVCKKTQIPMILICNERKQPKMRPFDFVTYDLPFRRPTTDMIRSRISTIAFREGLSIPPNVINALIEGSGADIRQVVNMISTAKLDSQTMTFEEGKDMSKQWEKHIILKPWDMVGKILGGGLFNPASKSTLNDKQELYFNDHEFAPLMLQENYLGTNPQRTNKFNDNPKRKNLAALELASKAADAISDGDLVDRMIHGSQQHWALMPTHAIFSFVRPSSFVWGSMAGHQTRFTSWLGKNSNQGKLMRMLKEIQGHMRLRTSADRFEVRQTYIPLLFQLLVRKLADDGGEAVPEVIDLMDEYFLTKDDWDAILELGVGPNEQEKVKIESSAKAAFTRKYNAAAHPMPFIKASAVGPASKKVAAQDKPDLEEAFEESEEEAAEDEGDGKEEEDGGLEKDKYVKVPKKRKAPAAGKAGGSKKKAKKGDDDDDDEEEEVKPKKGAAKGKGKAKK